MTSAIPPRRARELASHVESWFDPGRRELPWRRHYDPYHVWVSEVMAQQTRLEVAVPYFRRFVARFPDLATLAVASLDEVLALWSGLGYYRRARMLHEGARTVMESGGALPSDVESLRAVPGIGRYTAGAIASIAFDRPAPVVDGNVTRVAARLETMEDPNGSGALQRRLWSWAGDLVAASSSPRALNQGLMELGAFVCRPRKPRCGDCPVRRFCGARRAGDPEAWPRPKPAKASVAMVVPLYLVRDGERILFIRSAGDALMAGMAHLPHGTRDLFAGSRADRFRPLERLGSIRHTITQRRVEFEVWTATLREVAAEGSGEELWLTREELTRVAHPSYVRKALALAGDRG